MVSILLVNVLFILIPVIIDQVITERFALGPQRQKVLYGILFSLSIIFCMIFPYYTKSGFMYDLRAVPLFISFLYAGNGVGFSTTLVMLIFRYLIGGIGFYGTLIAYAPTILVVILITRRYRTYSRGTRFIVAAGIIVFENIFRMVGSFLLAPNLQHDTTLPIIACAVGIGALWLTMYVIEFFEETNLLRLEMIRSEKLQVVSQLAASIAHEVRNPMTAARGFAQLLNKEQNLTQETQRTYSSLIMSELDRAQEIITEYLSFAKPEAREDDEVDVVSEITHIVQVLTPYAHNASVELGLDIEGELRVKGQGTRMRQALMNLIKNAIEAIPNGGTVLINARLKAGYAEIQVIDNGIGMTVQELRQIGTPFYSIKSSGTGLGLANTYQTIKAMDGTIQASSVKGVGTSFTIRVPVSFDQLPQGQ